MLKAPKQQRGISLIISLVFLIAVTIFVLSATMTSMFGFRIATNTQTQNEATAAAQAAIDQKLADVRYFTEWATDSTTKWAPVSVTVGQSTYSVALGLPRCISSGPDTDYSAFASPPRMTLWRVTATATNASNGARATVTQGVRMRLEQGALCPN